jgi:RNA polymerase sigma-70 factor (ECF subfamily)
MTAAESDLDPALPTMAGLDPESAEWLRTLSGTGREREAGLARLYEMLRRIARTETRRRAVQQITGPERDDLADQAAADALLAITAKLAGFRGESRFTTWAYKFVIFEVSAKLGRHFWRNQDTRLLGPEWDSLPDRIGFEPTAAAECGDLIAALRTAVERELTQHQRDVFVAIVLNGVPLDALGAHLRMSRGAIYKTMFDARRKLRSAMVANGYLHAETVRQR